MKKLMALILALSLPLNSFAAECSAPVKLLEEGSSAPCRGYLFSPEKELEVRIKYKEHSLIKDELDSLNKMVEKLQKRDAESEKILQLEVEKTELWKTRAEDVTLKYTTVEENRGKRDLLFVLLGVGLTVLAGWSMGQAAGR
jgi:hypothetical protein